LELNEAKSKIPAGVTKNSTVVFEAAGDSVKVTINGTDRDGKPAHNERKGKLYGKDYPVTGDPNSDARSYKQVDDRTLELSKKVERLLSAAELWCHLRARSGRSQRVEPIRKAKSSKPLWCTTSSSGISPERAAYDSDDLPFGTARKGICL
jgi:hypothetical protein